MRDQHMWAGQIGVGDVEGACVVVLVYESVMLELCESEVANVEGHSL